MSVEALRFLHVVAVIVLGGGLLAVLVAEVRTRRQSDLGIFAELVKSIRIFYSGLVIPGAVVVGITGVGLVASYYDGWSAFAEPWIGGMAALYAFEFVEGNTVTRFYFGRVRRLTRDAVAAGRFTPELEAARAQQILTFTHFLDVPLFLAMVFLGVARPDSWNTVVWAVVVAVAVAVAMSATVPRLVRPTA